MIDEKKISEGAKKIFLASLTFIWGTFFFFLSVGAQRRVTPEMRWLC